MNHYDVFMPQFVAEQVISSLQEDERALSQAACVSRRWREVVIGQTRDELYQTADLFIRALKQYLRSIDRDAIRRLNRIDFSSLRQSLSLKQLKINYIHVKGQVTAICQKLSLPIICNLDERDRELGELKERIACLLILKEELLDAQKIKESMRDPAKGEALALKIRAKHLELLEKIEPSCLDLLFSS